MKSLITNYLNSRRSMKLEETNSDNLSGSSNYNDEKQNDIINYKNNENCNNLKEFELIEDDTNRLENSILELDLKFIDDNDIDTASILSSNNQNSNVDVQDNFNKNNNHLIKFNQENKNFSHISSLINNNKQSIQVKQIDSLQQEHVDTCDNLLILLEKLNNNIESLIVNNGNNSNSTSVVQSQQRSITNENSLKLKKFQQRSNNKNNENFFINQIKTCLFKINIYLNETIKTAKMDLEKNLDSDSNTTDLVLENKLLKDKIKNLEEKLKHNNEDDLKQLKETFEMMRIDRKRLKCEKLELLNQTKDLYKTIESKEKQIKDILKNFEVKTKETSQTVKKLIDSKVDIEKEKSELEMQVVDLLDEKNELKLIVEGKNATINKLQKQLFEYKSKSPRYSLGKESDYGYSSSKSRDTLSSSMIETNLLTSTITKNSTLKQKTKKEERSIKCKSNDSYLYIKNNQLNESSSLSHSKSSHKIKNKFKFSTLSKNSSYNYTSNRSENIKTSKSNNNLSFIISTSDYETDLNKVLDSDEFIDLDEHNSNQKLIENKALVKKTIDLKSDQKSSSSSSSSSTTSSSISFNTNKNHKQLEISSSTTIASVSPSVSLTSSSSSSYKTDQVDSSNKLEVKPEKSSLGLNISGESSESSSSDLSPLIMSQSITICEEDNLLNKTSNDFSNTSRYSVKQPLSMSMSMHTPSSNVKSRSSRILNTIIRMSTIGSSLSSSSTSSSINRSSTVIDSAKHSIPSSYSTTLSSAKVTSKINQPFVSSKSSYCVHESEEFNLNSKNLLNKSFKLLPLDQSCSQIDESLINDDTTCLKSSSNSAYKWSANEIRSWLEEIGMLPVQIKNGIKYVKNGKSFLNMSESELERTFLIANPMHKRKLKLAMDELRNPDKCKYPKLNEITSDWLVNTWLREIGLVYLKNVFKQNLVDGRVLASLQKKELEKYFGISKKNHQNSLILAIDLLRKHEFDIQKLKYLREIAQKDYQTLDISLWTNDNFIDWLKLVNLQSFLPKLSESGLHGALVADSSFNSDYLFNCLGADEEIKYQNMRKILEDEIKLLKKTKSNMKTDSVFSRPLTSFKSDKQRIFTFRGSLGRALGKKIKRDISSPLIDDDTFKRIEFSHKIVDMKNMPIGQAV